METEKKLKENFLNEGNDTEGLMNLLQPNNDKKQLSQKVHSGLVTFKKKFKLEYEMIGDHMLQYLVEPILVCQTRFKFYTKRRNLTRMEVLATIRGRIGFFAISNLFDRVEMKTSETDLVRKLQERHSFRLQ